MNIEDLRTYCLSKPQVTEDFPFDENFLTFKVMGKIFVLFSLAKWEAGDKSINLKCDPELALEWREQYNSVQPGYHMNKKHWNTVEAEPNEISDTLLKQMIDHSYDCVVKGFSKKVRDTLLSAKGYVENQKFT
ncbi:MAG: MmcQ/YjbR family DNA-binding protein [Capnocytophaga sp.]|nr:MmcQ/YjbR family DNA-binding protein [Capnocytophaga sp.]